MDLSIEVAPERVKIFHHTLHKRASLLTVDVGIGLCMISVMPFRYQDSDSFSTTSFLANTREQSSHRCLSGSMVSL